MDPSPDAAIPTIRDGTICPGCYKLFGAGREEAHFYYVCDPLTKQTKKPSPVGFELSRTILSRPLKIVVQRPCALCAPWLEPILPDESSNDGQRARPNVRLSFSTTDYCEARQLGSSRRHENRGSNTRKGLMFENQTKGRSDNYHRCLAGRCP